MSGERKAGLRGLGWYLLPTVVASAAAFSAYWVLQVDKAGNALSEPNQKDKHDGNGHRANDRDDCHVGYLGSAPGVRANIQGRNKGTEGNSVDVAQDRPCGASKTLKSDHVLKSQGAKPADDRERDGDQNSHDAIPPIAANGLHDNALRFGVNEAVL